MPAVYLKPIVLFKAHSYGLALTRRLARQDWTKGDCDLDRRPACTCRATIAKC